MAVRKPEGVSRDPWRSAKWDEVTEGRDFRPSDAPALALLVQWYQVVEQCMEDIGVDGGIQVAFANELGDIKALPPISTMKQASAEIRAINKQLGINDGRDSEAGEVPDGEGEGSYLSLIQGARADRRAGAQGEDRAAGGV